MPTKLNTETSFEGDATRGAESVFWSTTPPLRRLWMRIRRWGAQTRARVAPTDSSRGTILLRRGGGITAGVVPSVCGGAIAW